MHEYIVSPVTLGTKPQTLRLADWNLAQRSERRIRLGKCGLRRIGRSGRTTRKQEVGQLALNRSSPGVGQSQQAIISVQVDSRDD